MAWSISSAEPEKLFRYSDFGMQLDHELTLEAARLAATLQHFEATCTEPGFQVGVGHLAGNLRGHAGQNESVDSWVRQVGQGFRMADQTAFGRLYIPELPGQWTWILPLPIRLPSIWQMPIHIRPTLPRIRIPEWLMGVSLGLLWLKPKQVQVPPASWDRPEPERAPSEPAPEPVPTPTPLPKQEPEREYSGFGTLLDQAEREKQEKQQQGATAPQPNQEAMQEWWKSHGLNQIEPDLFKTLQGVAPNPYNACGPVALAMLMNFSAFVRGETPDVDPSALVKLAGQEKFFQDKLISFTEMAVLAEKKGFEMTPPPDSNGNVCTSEDNLFKQVKSGNPAIVLAKYSYDSNGNYVPDPKGKFDHFVIVSGVSSDGKTVTIANPHPGTGKTQNSDVVPVAMSLDDFRKIWEYDADNHMGQGFTVEPK